jgi:hypothetical protein
VNRSQAQYIQSDNETVKRRNFQAFGAPFHAHSELPAIASERLALLNRFGCMGGASGAKCRISKAAVLRTKEELAILLDARRNARQMGKNRANEFAGTSKYGTRPFAGRGRAQFRLKHAEAADSTGHGLDCRTADIDFCAASPCQRRGKSVRRRLCRYRQA